MDDLQTKIDTAVINALNRGSIDKKYVDIGRIPFICDDIRAIKQMMEGDNKTVQWLVKMTYLAIGGLGVIAILIIPIITSLISTGKL